MMSFVQEDMLYKDIKFHIILARKILSGSCNNQTNVCAFGLIDLVCLSCKRRYIYELHILMTMQCIYRAENYLSKFTDAMFTWILQDM